MALLRQEQLTLQTRNSPSSQITEHSEAQTQAPHCPQHSLHPARARHQPARHLKAQKLPPPLPSNILLTSASGLPEGQGMINFLQPAGFIKVMGSIGTCHSELKVVRLVELLSQDTSHWVSRTNEARRALTDSCSLAVIFL